MGNEKFEILRLLIENQDKEFSIREISKIRDVNYKSAYLAIKKLELEKIVNLRKLGNTINCSFNGEFNPLVFNVESKRREDILKKKNFKVIYERLKILNFPLICLLFGSSVKEKPSKSSDIDLIIITDNKKEVDRVLRLIPLDIHLTIISYDEFIKMLRSKEFSVVSEVIKKNVIFLGIEDYYRFLGVGLDV